MKFNRKLTIKIVDNFLNIVTKIPILIITFTEIESNFWREEKIDSDAELWKSKSQMLSGVLIREPLSGRWFQTFIGAFRASIIRLSAYTKFINLRAVFCYPQTSIDAMKNNWRIVSRRNKCYKFCINTFLLMATEKRKNQEGEMAGLWRTGGCRLWQAFPGQPRGERIFKGSRHSY